MLTTQIVEPVSQELMEEIGFTWHTDPDGSAYVAPELLPISETEAEAYYKAANELYDMFAEAGQHVIDNNLFEQLGIAETKLNSMRKVLASLKNQPVDFIVAEFFYGYGSNYAGVNISNLDVMLYSLQKYSPDTRVIVLVDKTEREYVAKLNEIFPVYAVLQYPASESDIKQILVSE